MKPSCEQGTRKKGTIPASHPKFILACPNNRRKTERLNSLGAKRSFLTFKVMLELIAEKNYRGLGQRAIFKYQHFREDLFWRLSSGMLCSIKGAVAQILPL